MIEVLLQEIQNHAELVHFQTTGSVLIVINGLRNEKRFVSDREPYEHFLWFTPARSAQSI